MDWSLLGCGRGGHVTYAPDEPDLRDQMSAVTGMGAGPGARGDTGGDAGEAWRCLRCGAFVPGPPDGSGPAAGAPRVRRGKELRSALILRIFAVERYLRAVIFGAAAVGVWQFSDSRSSLQRAFNRDLPDVRRLYGDLGFSFQRSKLIGLVQHALRLNSRTLIYLAIGLAAYAVIEIIEGTGLWLLKRWGEYFAMVATSVFLPYEIYDLSSKITALRVGAFVVNVALVVYLVITKRLLGARGGKRAYEERLREGSIIEQATEAAQAVRDGAGSGQVAGSARAGGPVEVADGAREVAGGASVTEGARESEGGAGEDVEPEPEGAGGADGASEAIGEASGVSRGPRPGSGGGVVGD